MKQSQTEASRPSVVPRREIPAADALGSGGLEVRPFEAHPLLSSVVPSTGVALSWTRARPGQATEMRSHTTRGLLIVLEGTAELVGPERRPVRQGDVITVPRLQSYGFAGVGRDGLHALHVSFAEQEGQGARGDASLAQLIARNEARMQAVLRENPFFLLLQSESIRDDHVRLRMCEALRVFSDAFQSILLTRQATCRDERFARVFRTHLLEELGHNEMLKVSGGSPAESDAVLRASASWFCHQMLVLDNVGKAVVNLVLETAGYHFHTLARAAFARDGSAAYFQLHAEEDEHHKTVGVELMQDLHPENYRRMSRVLEDAWDMFETMTKRIAYLVERGRASA